LEARRAGLRLAVVIEPWTAQPTGRAGDAGDAGDAARGAGTGAVAAALAEGDETVFLALVSLHQPAVLRLARQYVPDAAAAEALARDTWAAFLDGLDPDDRAPVRVRLVALLLDRLAVAGGAATRS